MNWITEQIAVTGAKITPENWCELYEEAGITAVVNLRAESQDLFSPPFPVAYLWLPVEDFTAPTREQLLIGVQFIDTSLRNGRRLLIHCKLGIGRSPTLAAAYLIWKGIPAIEAIRRIETPTEGYAPVVSREALEDFDVFLKEYR